MTYITDNAHKWELTEEVRKEIETLAQRQKIDPLLAVRKALALNARVVDELSQDGRIIVERKNKQLFELLVTTEKK